jgi:RNA polymerase sigma factor (sigma-70 family)
LDNVRREEREKRIFGEDILWRTKEENEDEEEENEVVDEARTPFETLLAVERLENVFRVLGYLTPSQRQLFELIFLGGHSYPEIAEILDISAALARKRVQLLREKLRRLTKSSQD